MNLKVVQSVLWAPRDRRLLSVGQDGSIYIWDVRSGDRLKDCIQPRSNFIAAALVGDLSSNNTRVFVAGSDMTLRTYTFNQAGELEGEANIQFDYPLKTLTLAGNSKPNLVIHPTGRRSDAVYCMYSGCQATVALCSSALLSLCGLA